MPTIISLQGFEVSKLGVGRLQVMHYCYYGLTILNQDQHFRIVILNNVMNGVFLLMTSVGEIWSIENANEQL